MDVKALLDSGVDTAWDLAGNALRTVDWTFIIKDTQNYDPTTDTFPQTKKLKKGILVLIFPEQVSMDRTQFSQAGRYVDPGVKQEVLTILIRGKDALPYTPSTEDIIAEGLVSYRCIGMNRYPTDVIFEMRAVVA